MMGEYNFPEGHKNKLKLSLILRRKTLKFIDTGLGMTADEVEKIHHSDRIFLVQLSS